MSDKVDAGAAAVEDDDAPPGFADQPKVGSAAPPSATAAAAGPDAASKDAAVLASKLAETQIESPPDAPDLSLKLPGLQERPEAEVTTQTAGDSIYSSAATFEELPLSPELLKGLYVEMKFERPSRIQALTLPMILSPPHKDLIAQAHNGSGKTTCFVTAMLCRVDPKVQATQAICLCPTRELVVQNLSVVNRIGKHMNVTTLSTAMEAEGGSSRLNAAVHDQVVVATHGKLKTWVSRRFLSLDQVRILVFDEADEMLKADGFADDSTRLIKQVRAKNPTVQLLLFSATFNDRIKRFATTIAPNANQVFVEKEKLSLDVIAQFNVKCPSPEAKTRVLKEMIFPNCERLGQTIIFVRRRETARTLHRTLEADGYKCTSISGEMEAVDRDQVVKEFREGITKILIATDVLSRGFDVSQVTLVINYDLPVERDEATPAYETYMHRIGRSGRFGKRGAAFNLTRPGPDEEIMNKISHYFNKPIESLAYDDEEAFVAVLDKTFNT